MVRFLKILSLAIGLIAVSLLTSGCFNQDIDESTIPWNRPAAWEDQVPGMGR
jgi:hypothetical protein